MRDPVEAYFAELRDIRASGAGVAETSYYGALATLLTEIGRGLKPKVRAVSQLRNLGAGAPDFGLYVQSQFAHAHDAEPLAGQLPARGVVEVKGTSADVLEWAKWPDAQQVPRYVERYGQVLVTNLRDFVLVGRDDAGRPKLLESCRLATTEAGFWAHAQQPRKFAEEAGEGLVEFLKRVMLRNALLVEPKDVAWFLASYARTARLRLEQKAELPALAQLREQLEESLGLEFEGDKGDHFFRSTLVQTLFYGVFAAWVLWSDEGSTGSFEWETAAWHLDVPMISALFHQFADPAKLGPLGITEVLDWTEEVLNRVDRAEFFARFRKEHAVQYFYEPFLEAFDPQLRKELGVWYTPDEVVRYMVARVDWALREELKIADGLADESVYVLDPCCGTGAYLVEVLRTIDRTLEANGADALTRQDVKRAAMKRVIGFEIMPAPFVVAHLQLGLLLAELGVPLSHEGDEHERAAIYLTNALTGWTADDPNAPARPGRRVNPAQLLFEFEAERDAAAKVKREAPILVVIGNPPYNGFAGVAEHEEADLVAPYKEGLVREWGIKKFNLDDLYIRFFRLAERTIAERGGRGVVSFISNFSWIGDASFVVMRKRLLSEFDSLWIDNLNGDSRETGKLTPEGAPDPSVFSTDSNREGIRVGTAISTLVRNDERPVRARVRYRELWGRAKRALLEDSLTSEPTDLYSEVSPTEATQFSLRPREVTAGYLSWPRLTDLSLVPPINGLMEKRAGSLFDVDRDALVERMRTYFDPAVAWDDLGAIAPGLAKDAAVFDAKSVRAKVLAVESFQESRVMRYALRPLEDVWAYYSAVPSLWNRARASLFAQVADENAFLLSRVGASVRDEGPPFYFTSALSDDHLLAPDASCFALMLPAGQSEGTLFDQTGGPAPLPNLSERAAAYVEAVAEGVDSRTSAGRVWMHSLAVGFSPRYLSSNRDGVRADWPRIPLPSAATALEASADLGQRVASLLDPAASVFVDVCAFVSPRLLGAVAVASGQLDPSHDLAVSARWAIAGKGGICMPSTGKLTERPYSDDELAAIAEAADARGLSPDEAVALLGETCFDVYLNHVAYWRGVPSNVWRYTIGGYQVIKKWLSYREKALLGRDLKPEEARYVTEMVRRIAALVLMQPELDANYERVKADVWEWGRGA